MTIEATMQRGKNITCLGNKTKNLKKKFRFQIIDFEPKASVTP